VVQISQETGIEAGDQSFGARCSAGGRCTPRETRRSVSGSRRRNAGGNRNQGEQGEGLFSVSWQTRYTDRMDAKTLFNESCMNWRRERDSNPRYPSGYSGFQDHRHRPLGHPSAFENLADNRAIRSLAILRLNTRGSVHSLWPIHAKSAQSRIFSLAQCRDKCHPRRRRRQPFPLAPLYRPCRALKLAVNHARIKSG
jgi:hypothetical protein